MVVPSHLNSCLEVDLYQVCQNYRYMRSLSKATCAAVVKADSYGLGAIKVSSALYKEGCKHFFVASLEEAIELREKAGFLKDCKIYVFSGVAHNTEDVFHHYGLIPVIISFEQIERWATFSNTCNERYPALLHIDTGLSRTGLCFQSQKRLIHNPDILKRFQMQAIISHLSCAHERNHPLNVFQLERFQEFIRLFPGYSYSLANSLGCTLGEEYHFDFTRVGFGLYGSTPMLPGCKLTVSLWSRILQIQSIQKNSYVGYSATYRSDRGRRLATVGIGYADLWSSPTEKNIAVSFKGKRLPLVGRMSMDLLTVDITQLSEAEVGVGDWVQLLGSQISLQEAAQISSTTPTKILSSLGGKRYYRVYNTEKQVL